MEGKHHSGTDRQSLITIFIVVYLICIACALVPMIMLFGLPENVKHNPTLQLGKSTEKQQKEVLEKYQTLIDTLEGLLKENKLGSDYRLAVDKLNLLAEEVKESGNPYHPVFKRVSYLYESFEKAADNYATIDELKIKLKEADETIKDLEKTVEEQKDEIKLKEALIGPKGN